MIAYVSKTTYKKIYIYNIYNFVLSALSVNHPVDAKEASAGAWTSMAFSFPVQTTAEETFSVKTSKTATTASENEADP